MLAAKNLHLSFGARPILNDVTLSLLPGERIALVGQNGMGKSTLLKVLARQMPLDGGSVDFNSRFRIGFLAQEPALKDDDTVLEAVRRGMAQLFADIEEHSKLCDKLGTCTDDTESERLHKRVAHLAHEIDSAGGFDVEHRVHEVLSRLHVSAIDQLIKTLSGGEKRRVDLARVMLSAPDIYLLDEPTNHLDVDAIEYLVQIFTSSQRPLLFISHDRAFIDDVATRIMEIDSGTIFGHEVPYAKYIENKLIRTDIAGRSLHRKERLMARELAWLRAGTPARTTKQNARISRAESLIDQVGTEIHATRERKVSIRQGQSKRLAKTVLELKNVGFAHGERVLFANVDLLAKTGECYGILGPNGAGKTTLLTLISGARRPTTGSVVKGIHTVIGQFDQNRGQLDPELSLKETLVEHGDYVFIGEEKIHIASYLERFLFNSSDMNRKVETLSGGEQNRLLLAKLFKQGANCLLLDEPTNDLDMPTLGVLEETLNEHDGVTFIVSHDRRFLDRVCTGIIAFEPSGRTSGPESDVVIYQGDYTTYTRLKAEQKKNEVAAAKVQPGKKDEPLETKRKQKRSFNEEREYVTIEAKIHEAEGKRSEIERALQSGELYRSDPKKAQELNKGLEALNVEIETLYARWQLLDGLNG